MARVENEAARCQAAMEQLKSFPVIDQQYRIEMVLTDDDKYHVICHYLDMEGWIDHTVAPAESLSDTPEGAMEGWNRLIDEKGRVRYGRPDHGWKPPQRSRRCGGFFCCFWKGKQSFSFCLFSGTGKL